MWATMTMNHSTFNGFVQLLFNFRISHHSFQIISGTIQPNFLVNSQQNLGIQTSFSGFFTFFHFCLFALLPSHLSVSI